MDQNFEAHPSQIELARIFTSVRLFGPPMSDRLITLVAHLFTSEEASVAKYLPLYYTRPIKTIARKARQDTDKIKPLLEDMANRRIIYKGEKGYSLLPLIPGMFEYMLMNGADTPWHRRYAELVNDLFSTGYVRQYSGRPVPAIRNIPVQSVIEGSSRVVDSDLMYEMIDCHNEFAVLNVCQCRQARFFTGHECKRSIPQDGCLTFGSTSLGVVKNGSARAVSKEEMRDIVQDRWEKKLVFMTANVHPSSPNAICTCCDCCCHFLESVNKYGGMTSVAPPHFMANLDESLCNNCGKCSKVCNTHAHTVEDKIHSFDIDKCIGCGLCVDACNQKAISMVENPAYKPPSRDFNRLGLRILPYGVLSALKVKLSR